LATNGSIVVCVSENNNFNIVAYMNIILSNNEIVALYYSVVFQYVDLR